MYIYVCMYVCMYVFMSLQGMQNVCVRESRCVYVCVHVCVVCMYVRVFLRMSVCVCMCMLRVCTDIYITNLSVCTVCMYVCIIHWGKALAWEGRHAWPV